MQSEQSRHSTRSHWEPRLEGGFIGAFILAQGYGWARLLDHSTSKTWTIVGFILGWACADLISGLVHFCADNYGSASTPLVGRPIIRTFREHHDHPLAMLSHDFLQRNGWNFGGAALVSVFAVGPSASSNGALGALILSTALFLSGTNQIHAWAHSEEVPQPVRQLQRWGLLLSPELHARHHLPYEGARNGKARVDGLEPERTFARGHYCITSGLCDRIYSLIRSA